MKTTSRSDRKHFGISKPDAQKLADAAGKRLPTTKEHGILVYVPAKPIDKAATLMRYDYRIGDKLFRYVLTYW